MSPETRRRWKQRFHAIHSKLPPKPRKIVATTLGVLLIAAGSAMILLPGPAFIVIPAGLAVLSTEYTWARKLFSRIHRILHRNHGKTEQQRRGAPVDRGVAEVTRRGFRVPL